MSEQLWGIRWQDHLPQQLTSDGIEVAYSSYEEVAPFISQHYKALFEQADDSPYVVDRVSAPKGRYYRLAGDFFAFNKKGVTVALLVGTPIDWSTYYVRSGAVLPGVQGLNLLQRFLPKLYPALRAAGVERVEAETSPSNMMMVHLLTRLRFNVSGTVLSERWGVLTRFTKFLSGENEDVFLKQFCAGVSYQRRAAS